MYLYNYVLQRDLANQSRHPVSIIASSSDYCFIISVIDL